MELREVFASELEKLMAADPRVCVVDADLAKASGTLYLRDRFPDRAFDAGAAEANMASIAAGLASYGFIPFITSFAPFATRRICDQLAISIAYAKSNVKVVGTDPGITTELNGGTHMTFEDVAIVRAIPGIVAFEPVDAAQLRQAMPVIAAHDGPVYIRLARRVQPDVSGEDYRFDLFKADVIRPGNSVTVLATGVMVAKALEAAAVLSGEGIEAEVVNVHTLKPLDRATILRSVAKTGRALTAENHSVIGGLYSAVCELTAAEYPIKVERVGVEDVHGSVGKLNELAEMFGLTTQAIVNKIRGMFTAL